MTEQQAPSLKEQLIALIRSTIAASKSEDPILVDFATRNLQSLLDRVDIVELTTETEEFE